MDCIDDNLLTRFAAGQLPPDERAPVDAHLDACEACRKVVVAVAMQATHRPSGVPSLRDTSPAAATAAQVPAGTPIGRYVVQSVLGTGGMGVVYGAYDPQLDREVALKLLKPGLLADGEHRIRDRMVREARALAQLAHPNVVVVHDAGLHGDQVYLAMEWVRGQTLRGWCRQAPRSTRELVDIFLQAGRGLAAAHAQGIVHRDFKPENVLVGTDGRARVTDFGLALRTAEPPPLEAPSSPTGSETSFHDAAITRTGTLLGTPAYMPPEQARGAAVDARADQYAFFKALAEALAGDGTSKRRVPGHLQRAIARGTEAEPSRRFPSMDAALGAIEAGRRRRRLSAVAAGVTLAFAAVTAASAAVAGAKDVCAGADRHVAEVWSGPRRDALKAAFLATGRPYAGAMSAAVVERIDAWARRWERAHRDACEATRVHAEQTEAVMTLRMSCLNERLRELDAVQSVLVRADAQVVDRALDALGAMGELQACADPEALASRLPPPADPQLRLRADAVVEELNALEALFRAGRVNDGEARVQEAARLAAELGWPPATARAQWLLGVYQRRLGRDQAAQDALYRAASEAVTAGSETLAARAWVELVRLVPPAEEAAASRTEQLARAYVGRTGSPELQAQLYTAVGYLESRRHRQAEAVASFERALALFQSAPRQDAAAVATAHMNLGNALGTQNRLEQALVQYRQALAANEQALGRDHPDVAQVQFNLGITLARAGRFGEAEAPMREALRVYEATLGPRAPQTAAVLGMLANVLTDLERTEDAIPLLLRAVETLEADPQNPRLATALANLANALLAAKRPREALPHARRALELKERALGPDNPGLSYALVALGTAHLDSGDAVRAVALLRRALQLQEKAPVPPMTHAETRLRLAQALWATGRKQEALRFARSIAAIDAGPETESLRADAAKWMKAVTTARP